MIRIDWIQLCEMAFLDDCDRLCMVGVMTRFPAPELPIAMRQIMIVVRVKDAQPKESFTVGVSMVTPSGLTLHPQNADGFDIAVTPEYIFITLRDIPLSEEGMHHLAITVGSGAPASIHVPVRVVKNQAPMGGQGRHQVGAASWVSGRQVN
jgi:hypothetical protein